MILVSVLAISALALPQYYESQLHFDSNPKSSLASLNPQDFNHDDPHPPAAAVQRAASSSVAAKLARPSGDNRISKYVPPSKVAEDKGKSNKKIANVKEMVVSYNDGGVEYTEEYIDDGAQKQSAQQGTAQKSYYEDEMKFPQSNSKATQSGSDMKSYYENYFNSEPPKQSKQSYFEADMNYDQKGSNEQNHGYFEAQMSKVQGSKQQSYFEADMSYDQAASKKQQSYFEADMNYNQPAAKQQSYFEAEMNYNQPSSSKQQSYFEADMNYNQPPSTKQQSYFEADMTYNQPSSSKQQSYFEADMNYNQPSSSKQQSYFEADMNYDETDRQGPIHSLQNFQVGDATWQKDQAQSDDSAFESLARPLALARTSGSGSAFAPASQYESSSVNNAVHENNHPHRQNQ
ncbi:hypothetical protein BC833DRAFT_604916 [Globomyces pollinis-pini]|nr:hypothetical protein BC833DRAFT_604916 [Globomyces pollinis-pini]